MKSKASHAKPAPPAEGNVASSAEETITIDTDLYHIIFSNRGGVVKNWTLKKYPDHAGKPLDVVNVAAAAKDGYPLQFDFRDAKPPVDLNQALFKATRIARRSERHALNTPMAELRLTNRSSSSATNICWRPSRRFL